MYAARTPLILRQHGAEKRGPSIVGFDYKNRATLLLGAVLAGCGGAGSREGGGERYDVLLHAPCNKQRLSAAWHRARPDRGACYHQ